MLSALTKRLAVLAVITSVWGSAALAATSAGQTQQTYFPPETYEGTKKELNDFQTQRAQAIAHITAIINASSLSGTTADTDAALEAIGYLKLTELAPLCVQYLYATGYIGSMGIFDTNRYEPDEELHKTAFNALVEMGSNSVPALVEAAASGEMGSSAQYQPGSIILKIYGEKAGAIIIQQAIDAEKDPTRKANLIKWLNPSPIAPEGQKPSQNRAGGTSPASNNPSPESSTEQTPQGQATVQAGEGFPWYVSGIIGLVLGVGLAFGFTRIRKQRPPASGGNP